MDTLCYLEKIIWLACVLGFRGNKCRAANELECFHGNEFSDWKCTGVSVPCSRSRPGSIGRCSVWTVNSFVWLVFYGCVTCTVVANVVKTASWVRASRCWALVPIKAQWSPCLVGEWLHLKWWTGDRVVQRIAAWVQFTISWRVGCAEAVATNCWAGSAWKGQAPKRGINGWPAPGWIGSCSLAETAIVSKPAISLILLMGLDNQVLISQ